MVIVLVGIDANNGSVKNTVETFFLLTSIKILSNFIVTVLVSWGY